MSGSVMSPRWAAFGLAVGLGAGLVVHWSESTRLLDLAVLIQPVGLLWGGVIRLCAIPMVVVVPLAAVLSSPHTSMGRLGALSVLVFLALIVAGSLFALLVTPPLIDMLASHLAPLQSATSVVPGVSPAGVFDDLPGWYTPFGRSFRAASRYDRYIVPLLILTIVVGSILRSTNSWLREVAAIASRGASRHLFTVITRLLWFAPIGIFSLALSMTARSGLVTAEILGWYIAIVCGELLVFMLLIYPATGLITQISLGRFAAAVAPAQMVAAATRSSLASLPALVDGALRRLSLPEPVVALRAPAIGRGVQGQSARVRPREAVFSGSCLRNSAHRISGRIVPGHGGGDERDHAWDTRERPCASCGLRLGGAADRGSPPPRFNRSHPGRLPDDVERNGRHECGRHRIGPLRLGRGPSAPILGLTVYSDRLCHAFHSTSCPPRLGCGFSRPNVHCPAMRAGVSWPRRTPLSSSGPRMASR